MSDERLRPRPVRPSLVDRIMGRVRTEAPAWQSIGPDRRLVTLPSDSLAGIADAFQDDLKRRFASPWTSTSVILDYLRTGVMTPYLRGDQEAGNLPEWYIQLTFSGCAGLCELSAALAVHWAERWHSEHVLELTSTFFDPVGFAPTGRVTPSGGGPMFVPLGAAGYGIIDPGDSPRESASDSPMLDVDQWALEAIENVDSTQLLERAYAAMPELRSSRLCHCQWCAPDLDPTPLHHVVH